MTTIEQLGLRRYLRAPRALIQGPSKLLLPLLYWLPAILTGCIAVLYARLFDETFKLYREAFSAHALLVSLLTPLGFLTAAALVKKVAPQAGGSGIPQVLHAIHEAPAGVDAFPSHKDKVSLKTMFVKIFSSGVAMLSGASIGREGPTVQIASSVFGVAVRFARRRGWKIDYRSFLIAGGSAGVAAAFNTPLAGITFAIEEIAENYFFQFRQEVMITVIIAGITAQALVGDYLYFGHPATAKPSLLVLPAGLLIGLLAGAAGGIFALLLSTKKLHRVLPDRWWLRALACGAVCAALAYATHGDTSGSGYGIVKNVMDGEGGFRLSFGIEKFVATVLSYLSGAAGGIFSPCLAIGAGFGYAIGELAGLGMPRICALLGMVSFFSGAVQAPLTSVIIVMEMTDEHILVIPFMIAAYVSYGVSKLMMPEPLYRKLAHAMSHAAGTGEPGTDETDS